MKIVYKANDGIEFDNKEDCEEYEKYDMRLYELMHEKDFPCYEIDHKDVVDFIKENIKKIFVILTK